MTGKELKKYIAAIPDDAAVLICGPDSGGYDWTFCNKVKVLKPSNKVYEHKPSKAWFIVGEGTCG